MTTTGISVDSSHGRCSGVPPFFPYLCTHHVSLLFRRTRPLRALPLRWSRNVRLPHTHFSPPCIPVQQNTDRTTPFPPVSSRPGKWKQPTVPDQQNQKSNHKPTTRIAMETPPPFFLPSLRKGIGEKTIKLFLIFLFSPSHY